MKTFDGKNITKAVIRCILRSENVQAIFHLTHLLNGGAVKREQVFQLVRDYAPTERVRAKAYTIAYDSTHAPQRARKACTPEAVQRHAA